MNSKTKQIFFSPLKCLFVTFIFIVGVPGIEKCNAQSIIGKWQRDLTVVYTTDKATGKQVPLSPDKQKQYTDAAAERGYLEILEFKSDGTYTSTVTAGGEKKVQSEHYSLTGNKLDLNIPLVMGEKTYITIASLTSAKMIWDLVFMKKLTGVGYKRI
jgi:hypothetical protein